MTDNVGYICVTVLTESLKSSPVDSFSFDLKQSCWVIFVRENKQKNQYVKLKCNKNYLKLIHFFKES
jgi:hypothetical protein